ncbi:MAG: GerW family sporulation protein [bacterium]|nr:GerW family sporulation protein [bacterium]
MENQTVETLSLLLQEFQKYGAADSVIGKELHIGEVTIVPISKLSLGVGAGASTSSKKGEEKGGGCGGGLKVEPIAFLVVQKERVSLLGLGKKGPLDALSEQIPDLIDKWIGKRASPAPADREKEG